MQYINIIHGEFIKQKNNYYNSKSALFSVLVWPILILAINFYTYKTFDVSLLAKYGIKNMQELFIFLVTGSLGYYCFYSCVQSALYIENERENGTLEMVLITPANRIALMCGRSLGGLIQSSWMYIIFSAGLLMISSNINIIYIEKILFAYLIILVSSVIWGILVNSIFMISRSIDFWFVLFDEPMKLLSGSTIPITAFTNIIKIVSSIFPLTYCLLYVRYLFLDLSLTNINNVEIKIIISNILVLTISYIIIKIAEKNGRKNGSFQFY